MSIKNLTTDDCNIDISLNTVNCKTLQTDLLNQEATQVEIDQTVTSEVFLTTSCGRINIINVGNLPAGAWHTFFVIYDKYSYPDSYVQLTLYGVSSEQRKIYPSYWWDSTPGQFSLAFTNISTTTALITTLQADYHIINKRS